MELSKILKLSQISKRVITNIKELSNKKEVIFMRELKITSPAFNNDENIPKKYTCEGKNISPQIDINNVPEGTETFVIIVDDPDAPNKIVTHWIVFNITGQTRHISEGAIPGIEGRNDFRDIKYKGPCPPNGTHKYYFRVYALKDKIYLEREVSRDEIELHMKDKIIASGTLIGKYRRKDKNNEANEPNTINA